MNEMNGVWPVRGSKNLLKYDVLLLSLSAISRPKSQFIDIFCKIFCIHIAVAVNVDVHQRQLALQQAWLFSVALATNP